MCGSGGGGVNGFKKFSADIESMCLVLGGLTESSYGISCIGCTVLDSDKRFNV